MKIVLTTLVTLVLAAGPLYAQDADQPPPTPAQEEPEVLTSGPVHEAFAEPVDLETQEDLVVPDEPPARIQELPPAEKPQGAQFVWVPGYWAWDAGRHGYIWVSACWRAAPPKTYWVPGYWTRVPGGWEWIPGFWASAGAQEIQYLPAPPTIENLDPPGLPPAPDDIWAPPCRYWYQGHYILRPGYWVHGQVGWTWIPSHYIQTPRGYVFVAGHWDYALEHRGVLFAPVAFPLHVRQRPGFSYRLNVVVDLGVLRVNLFTYPRYHHYCFGDYYDDAYVRIGIFPRCDSERHHGWYDPIYQYDRWNHVRTDPHWVEKERQDYDRRRTDKDLRPPRTYHEMQMREAKLPEPQRKDVRMARPLSEVAARKDTPLKFEPVRSTEQKRITRQADSVRKFGDQRTRWETPAAKKPATPAPESKKGANPPSGHKEPTPASTEHKDPAGPAASKPTDHGPAPATSRMMPTKPETVKIPKPPLVGRSVGEGRREGSLPPKPTEERQTTRDTKGKDADRGKGKDENRSR